jgi:hypothetical protein
MSIANLHDLHRPLGSTGLTVSPLGLGTVKLGRDQGVKYPNGFQIPGDEEARMLLRQARELGRTGSSSARSAKSLLMACRITTSARRTRGCRLNAA